MKGIYAQIAVDFEHDAKMVRAGWEARAVYLHALLYCRDKLTDGLIERDLLPLWMFGHPLDDRERCLDRLVELGALDADEAGWRVPIDVWERWNPTRESLAREKAERIVNGYTGNHRRWKHAGSLLECADCLAHLYTALHNADAWDAAVANGLVDGHVSGGRSGVDRGGETGAIAHRQRQSRDKAETETSISSHPAQVKEAPGDNSEEDDDSRIEAVVGACVAVRANGKQIGNRAAWDRTVSASVRADHGNRIAELVGKFPNAPATVIANYLETGDGRTLAHYQEQT